MSKSRLLASAFILVLLVSMMVGVQFVRVANASWIVLPTQPIKDPPTLIMYSPINNYSFNETSVLLNFTVIKPTSWGPSQVPGTYYNCGISSIQYVLDGTTCSLFQAPISNPIPQDELPTVSNFSENLEGLTIGAHNLQVIIYGQTQWDPNNSGLFGTSIPPFYFYNMTVTSGTINFNVVPTSPSSEGTGNFWLDYTYFTAIATLIAALAVASASIIYFRRKRVK